MHCPIARGSAAYSLPVSPSSLAAGNLWETWLPEIRVGLSTASTHSVPFGYLEEKSAYASKLERVPQEGSSMLLLGLEGMLYYKLLPQWHTVTAPVHAAQLQKLAQADREKRPR